MSTTVTHPTTGGAVGHNDSIQNGRIGRGAVSLEIDFAKIKALFNDGKGVLQGDVLLLTKLPGNSYVRTVAAQIVKPLELADADGVAATYESVVLTPTTFADGVSGTAVGASTVTGALNFQGKTFFGDQSVLLNDVDADGEQIENDLRIVATTVAANKYIVGGKAVITVYSDYAFTAEELVGVFDPQHGEAVNSGSSVADGGEV